MTTKQLLNELLSDLAQMTGQATSKEQANKLGRDKYLFMEYASVYGGYRIVNVGVSNGAHYGAFGGSGTEGRLTAKMMEVKLRSLIAGIRYATEKLTA
jgi:hypothetical protein